MKRFAVPLVSLMLVLAGCGNNSPMPPPPMPTPTPAPTPAPTPPVTPPITPPGTATLTGTWSGTTITDAFGTEPTAFTFTQSGSQVSGTLALTDSEGESFSTPVTGSVSSSSATVSGLYDLDDGSELEYRYEGIFSDTTYSGTVTLLVDGAAQQQGQFSVTKGATTPPTTPPTTPGTDDSISGTIFTPGGVSAAGATVVGACYLPDPSVFECDESLSVEIELPPGSSLPYTISGLAAGQYAIVAGTDSDGNGSFVDAGDFIGGYPSVQSLESVSPGATGIDITMVLRSSLPAPASLRDSPLFDTAFIEQLLK